MRFPEAFWGGPPWSRLGPFLCRLGVIACRLGAMSGPLGTACGSVKTNRNNLAPKGCLGQPAPRV